MDIHPPEHPIRSVRDFLLQIFTITCGIVIALALDGLVVNRRDASLVRTTRQDFAAEIADNMGKVQAIQGRMEADEDWIKQALAYGDARLKHQGNAAFTQIARREFITLRNAAWETALATQAMRLLHFDEARALATAYNQQAQLNEISAHAVDQWIGIAAFGNIPDLTDAEMRDAMRQLRVAYAYTISIAWLEREQINTYKAAEAAMAQYE
ncbi:MAG TPA: hypothetical protein VMB71_11930 [Acetobacteraceae bacterium]|nr:hypothetical protein [Acetobacteraceae bacterium]